MASRAIELRRCAIVGICLCALAYEQTMDITGHIEWNERLEQLIAEEGEKSLCFAWLHGRAEALYSYRNNFIALPVIVLSTLAGTASIGAGGLFGNNDYASVGIGLVSISVGILNTIGQYFSWAKRSEGHRIASITYQKLYRFISVELSLPRRERMKAADLLKVVREQYDRLSETSPMVPKPAIVEFQTKFKHYTEIARPEITNGLEKIYIYEEIVEPATGQHVSKLKQKSELQRKAGVSMNAMKHALKDVMNPSDTQTAQILQEAQSVLSSTVSPSSPRLASPSFLVSPRVMSPPSPPYSPLTPQGVPRSDSSHAVVDLSSLVTVPASATAPP